MPRMLGNGSMLARVCSGATPASLGRPVTDWASRTAEKSQSCAKGSKRAYHEFMIHDEGVMVDSFMI